MRDYFVFAVVMGSLPFILRRPWIGIIMWCWLSYMNPHKLSWSFAREMPFAMLVALATLTGMLFMREPRRLPLTRETVMLIVLVLWMCLTTYFAFFPELAIVQLDKVWRIQLMTLVTLMLITNEQRLKAFVWIVALSLAFYGVKGGIHVLTGGSGHRVWGPEGSFIQGNNELGLTLIMIIPLLRFLQLQARQRWLNWGLGGGMLLTAVAAVGTHSRGAFIAIVAVALMLWYKSRNRLAMGALGIAALVVVLVVMPPEYYERLTTIKTYNEDNSAMGRINAWWVAWRVALERPFLGGGFDMFQPLIFQIHAPDPTQKVLYAHSIYFQVLGEHGFAGLGLFLGLFGLGWLTAGKVRRLTRKDPELLWLGDLAAMVQVCLVGYLVGGAFLGLAYFDLPYHLVCMAVIARLIVEERIRSRAAAVVPAMPRRVSRPRAALPVGAAQQP